MKSTEMNNKSTRLFSLSYVNMLIIILTQPSLTIIQVRHKKILSYSKAGGLADISLKIVIIGVCFIWSLYYVFYISLFELDFDFRRNLIFIHSWDILT